GQPRGRPDRGPVGVSSGSDPAPRVLSLVGGKGGVGTSLLTTTLGIHLARQGREVVVADLAPGGAHLHAHLGLHHPVRHLLERARPDPPPLADLLVATGIPNLRLLAGSETSARQTDPHRGFAAQILGEARGLPCDFVVADIGSGSLDSVRRAAAVSDRTLMVCTPEPAAARGLLSLHAGILEVLVGGALGNDPDAEKTSVLAGEGMRSLLAALASRKPARKKVLHALRSHRFGLLVNQVRTVAETEVAASIGAVFSMLQAIIVDPVMTFEYDLSAQQAVSEGCVLAQRYPNAPIVRGLEKTAFCLLAPPPAPGHQPNRYLPLSAWHHYRLLALDPKASPREVQRHYERVKAPFQPDGTAEAVASRAYLDQVLAQVDTAYRTLIFLENRREYDQSLVAGNVLDPADLREHDEADPVPEKVGAPADARPAPTSVTPAASPPRRANNSRETDLHRPASKQVKPGRPSETSENVPTIHDDGDGEGPPQHYTGAVLRDLRRRRRLGLDKISAMTKIRAQHIASIENENYGELPVEVFVKGFVRAYARCLDLDAERVVTDYMDGYGLWRQERT
ncbi:MAG: helix-turn-helix domain-containing protein, partial [Acidobacteriota bacterium]